MNNQKMWIAFMLRDKYANNEEKANLKINIMNKFNRNEKDIRYTSFEMDSGTSYYFFVKQYDAENDLQKIHEAYVNIFESFYCHTRIEESQLTKLFQSIEEKENINAKFGDLVMINKGQYNKLYGIVLRQNRQGKYDVGLKFGFGVVLKSYDASSLNIIGNLFNYIKVLY